MNTESVTKSQTSTSLEGQLKAILYLLQENLEEHKREVDRSYELLKIGEKTELTRLLESQLNNPLGNISKMSGDIDNQLKYIIDGLVKSFFQFKKDLIHKVFRSQTSLNDLHYSIILKEDNFETRNELFDFFDKYDLFDISIRYPVMFQFVPIELIQKVRYTEEISFEE